MTARDESRSAPKSRVYSDQDDDRLLRIDAALSCVPLARYDDVAKLAEYAVGEFIQERDKYKAALIEVEELDPEDWNFAEGWRAVEFIQAKARAALSPSVKP